MRGSPSQHKMVQRLTTKSYHPEGERVLKRGLTSLDDTVHQHTGSVRELQRANSSLGSYNKGSSEESDLLPFPTSRGQAHALTYRSLSPSSKQAMLPLFDPSFIVESPSDHS